MLYATLLLLPTVLRLPLLLLYNPPPPPSPRESLAVAAASGQELDTGEGETFIERYSKGVSAVETILLLDRCRLLILHLLTPFIPAPAPSPSCRLRQNVAVKEKLAAQRGKREAIRKTMSVPNFVQMSQSLSCDSFSSLQMRSSCSFQVGLNLDPTIRTLNYVHSQSAE